MTGDRGMSVGREETLGKKLAKGNVAEHPQKKVSGVKIFREKFHAQRKQKGGAQKMNRKEIKENLAAQLEALEALESVMAMNLVNESINQEMSTEMENEVVENAFDMQMRVEEFDCDAWLKAYQAQFLPKNVKRTFKKSLKNLKLNQRLKDAGVVKASDRRCLTKLVKDIIGRSFDYDTLTNTLAERMPRFIYVKHKHGDVTYHYGGAVECYWMPCDEPYDYVLPKGKELSDYDFDEWKTLPKVWAGANDIGIGMIKVKGHGLNRYRQETLETLVPTDNGKAERKKEKIRFRQFEVTEIEIDFDFFAENSRRLQLLAKKDKTGHVFCEIREVINF